MPNLILDTPLATFVHDDQVRLFGHADNIPNTDVLWFVITTVSGQYFPSGNEFCAGPPPGVPGNNTVDQQFDNIHCGCGLVSNTTYFARIERHTAGNTPLSDPPIEVSNEVSFTTSDGSNYWSDTCDSGAAVVIPGFGGGPDGNGISRNTVLNVDPAANDLPNCHTNEVLDELSTTGSAGPWSPASTILFGVTPRPALPSAGEGFGQGTSVGMQSLNQCQEYFFRKTLLRDGFPSGEEMICGPYRTSCYPVPGCAAPGGGFQNNNGTFAQVTRTHTSLALRFIAVGNATGSQMFNNGDDQDANNIDEIRVSWGTTPGGPYPNVVQEEVGGNLEHTITITGINPNQQVYYIVEFLEKNNPDSPGPVPTVYATSPECTQTTLSYGPICSDATAVTPSSAQLNGTVDGVPANQFARFVWGTTPGGPYPNVTPNIAGSGAQDQALSATLNPIPSNTTFYYKVQVLDTDGVTVIEEQVGECTFNTVDFNPEVEPVTNVTQTEADLHGHADAVPPGLFIRISYGTTPGGPYPLVSPLLPGDGTLDQDIDFHVTGLTPGTQYCYVVEVIDSDMTTVLDTSVNEECFITEALPAVDTLPPTNVTTECATMNGQSTDTPAGCTYVFDYGATPGGPYTHTATASVPPGGTSTGATPENFSATICGLKPNQTIYYRARTICNNETLAVGPDEEIITTADGVYYCGMLFDMSECVFVDPGNGEPYWYCFCETNELFNTLANDDRPDTGAGDC